MKKHTPNDNLEKLTADVVGSYHSDDHTQRIGLMFLPSQSKIEDILIQARQLLFPGYFGHKKFTRENVSFVVGDLLAQLESDLTEQINYCMCADRRRDEPTNCLCEAQATAHKFLGRIPKIRKELALDAQAAYDGDPAAKSIDEIIYCYPGFYAVTVYRIAHELHELSVPLMPRIMTECAHSITGTDIHPGAKIGKSFFIDHATGVVIGETTHIGDNVKIYQGVTLGAKSFPKDKRGRVIRGRKRHPTLEDNATIYANATILGGRTVIGKGVTVSGNTLVTKSITEHSVVTQDTPRLRVKSMKNSPVKKPSSG